MHSMRHLIIQVARRNNYIQIAAPRTKCEVWKDFLLRVAAQSLRVDSGGNMCNEVELKCKQPQPTKINWKP